jgi:hypothetical protein
MENRFFDVMVSKTDKICRKDDLGFFQPTEYGYALTEKNVPESEVTARSLELRLKITRFICNAEVLDGKKTKQDALDEIHALEKHLVSWRLKNGDTERDGSIGTSSQYDAGEAIPARLASEAPAGNH